MYWHAIITYLIWPVLVLITYGLVNYLIKKTEYSGKKPEEKTGNRKSG